ncbi:hypothetical protein Ga0074812_11175 [Parafrankia irregularis]|uniref:Uncharacterized protein n=1 Tax=Parafrankia irregularis TaxID=795642 RepID=A0A0S4QNL6_9ACTN|nr:MULTISPECIES: hypothetical protein [Parafrankia]MBE3204268.1 hypothetical protein [Parafrankia sp. CH37]CUU57239.1 hypothetical protein Ga0074812_11175 [Parafrankia irregularis]
MSRTAQQQRHRHRHHHRRRATGPRRRFLAVLVLLAGSGLLTLGGSTPAWAADTTQYAGDTTRGLGVAVPFEGLTDQNGNPVPISGAVGVDLVLGSTQQPYLPCQNYNRATGTGDTYVNACQERGSYATYTRFATGKGLMFPHGYFMGDSQPDLVHGGTLNTSWGSRTAGLSFEFYPQLDRDPEFVHSRFYIDVFDHHANGWTYSAWVGRIKLATLNDPGTARVGGRLTDGGRAPAKDRVKFLIFGGNAESSNGYPISSFAVFTSSGASTWDSGAMYAGPQRITVTDTATNRECVIDLKGISGRNNTLDLDLAQPGFGAPGAVCH